MMGVTLVFLVLNGCSDETPEQIKHIQDNTLEELTFTAKSFQRANGVDSRTALIMPDNEYENAEFIWTTGDTIGIVPCKGAQAYFVIEEGVESNKATFSGGSWALKTQNSNDYAAYYPLVYDMMLDRTQVPVDYTGQVYKPAASNKLSSLANHDYMAAKATVATGANNVNFEFQHLGVLMEIQFSAPQAGEVTQVILSSDEKIFPLKGTFNLEAETLAITPNPEDISNSLTVNIEELETTSAGEVVSVYFMVPPIDLSGKSLNMTVTYEEVEKNFVLPEGENMQAGRWYTFVAEEYEQRPAYIQLSNDFSTSLNDVLGTLGGTKLKFVPNSEATSETVVFEDTENGVNAYAVKNGDWLEVHTSAKEFMAPESCRYAFYSNSTTNPNFASLTTIDFIGFNTSKVMDMTGMFMSCSALISMSFDSSFKTSSVTSMHEMFGGCKELEALDLSTFDTSKVEDMRYIFSGCKKLPSLNLSNFDTSSVKMMGHMFRECSSIESIVFGNKFNTSKVHDMTFMFAGCTSSTSLDLSRFDTSSVTSMSDMFMGCTSLTSLDLSNFDTSLVVGMSGMFQGCSALESITLGNKFNTSKVDNMYNMFSGCASLESFDLSQFDTSSVEDMQFMFEGCTSFTSFDLSKNDMSSLKITSGMFAGCTSLESIIFGDNFKAPLLWDINGMFANCTSLVSIDLSSFDTSSVTHMNNLFESCTSLKSVTFGGKFNTSSVEDMGSMFYNCTSIVSLDLSSFDTSSVFHMSSMFEKCHLLSSLDLSGFTFTNDVYCGYMFRWTGQECENSPCCIYVTDEGKRYLDKQSTEIGSSYAQLVVKDTEP